MISLTEGKSSKTAISEVKEGTSKPMIHAENLRHNEMVQTADCDVLDSCLLFLRVIYIFYSGHPYFTIGNVTIEQEPLSSISYIRYTYTL